MQNADYIRLLLRQAIDQGPGTQSAWAEAHNVSPQYVADVLNGRRDPGESILSALGYERIVGYQKAARAKGRKG